MMVEEKKKVRILLHGYNGENNTGSEAKLLTTIMDLKETVGDRIEELVCLTFTEELQRRYVKDPDVKIIEIGEPKSLLRNVPKLLLDRRGYDILILNEGSTFIDHFGSPFMWMFCFEALVAKFRGQKVVAYANDCGKLRPFNRWVLRKTLNKIDLIMLRNPDAVSRMKEYGVKKEIHCTADGAYEYPLPPKSYRDELFKKLRLEPDRKPIIGLAPKEFFWWPIKYKPFGPKEDRYRIVFYHTWPKGAKEWSKKYIQQMARYADYCVERFGATVPIIAMERMDYPPSKAIYESMKHKEEARLISSNEWVVDDIISILSILKFHVTTRYHTCVLSSCSGVPAIAVSSDTRLEAVFRELDMMEFYLDYVRHEAPVPPSVPDIYEWLVDRTESLVKRESEVRERILKAHKNFLERAMRNKAIFKKWFDENFPS